MDFTLQIFVAGHWTDCAQIDFNDGFCQWHYQVMYAVEHMRDPLSLADPVDLDLRSARSLPAFL
jgi:serine/threonine-protein kinase HipA